MSLSEQARRVGQETFIRANIWIAGQIQEVIYIKERQKIGKKRKKSCQYASDNKPQGGKENLVL